jgi:hypothetical protein
MSHRTSRKTVRLERDGLTDRIATARARGHHLGLARFFDEPDEPAAGNLFVVCHEDSEHVRH